MNNQLETLQALAKKQQAHIAVLNQKIAFQQQMIQQYKSELLNAQERNEKIMAEYSNRLDELTTLRDSYKKIVAETQEIKDDYAAKLTELRLAVRGAKYN